MGKIATISQNKKLNKKKNFIIINKPKRKYPGSIKLTYSINKNNETKTSFLDKNFFLDNYSKYKIIYNNKRFRFIQELSEFYRNNEIIVRLVFIGEIKILRSLFENCNTLKNISGYLILNENHTYDVNKMFSGCSLLKSLSDFSIYNLNKVNNLSKMFYDCKSLNSLIDISKMDTSNVKKK